MQSAAFFFAAEAAALPKAVKPGSGLNLRSTG